MFLEECDLEENLFEGWWQVECWLRCGKKGGGWVQVVLEWTGNNWGEQKRKREADVKQEKKTEHVDR